MQKRTDFRDLISNARKFAKPLRFHQAKGSSSNLISSIKRI